MKTNILLGKKNVTIVLTATLIFCISLSIIGCNDSKDFLDNKNIKSMDNNLVKFGQVYRATRDVQTGGSATYKAPVSSGFDCTIPRGTRIVIENDPPKGATGVWAIPLNYKELEERLVPSDILNSPKYDTYGVSVSLDYLERCFVKEDVKEIKFDDDKIQEHWGIIVKVYNQQKGKTWDGRTSQKLLPPQTPKQKEKEQDMVPGTCVLEPGFKGMELYSYASDDKEIKYSLVSGTDRNKTAKELVEQSITYEGLIEKIKMLAPNENVFWFNVLPAEYINEAIVFQYPSDEKIKGIQNLCKGLGINLHINK